MNAFVQNASPNGNAHEHQALDKPAGEAAPGRERDERLARQLDRLDRVADMAMDLAQGLVRKARRIEDEGGEGYEAACLAFARITRAVGQINFQEQEILGLRETQRREAREISEKAEQEARQGRKQREKGIAYATVQELLKADGGIGMFARAALDEKFSRDYDGYYDLYRGSFEEIIARICRDLGIDAAPEAGSMSNDPDAPALAPADTPIGARQRIESAAARIQSLQQGTGPP